MNTPIAIGEKVTVRDPHQVTAKFQSAAAAGPWVLAEVCGVAARIGRFPGAPVTLVTPLSNLRPAGGAQ